MNSRYMPDRYIVNFSSALQPFEQLPVQAVFKFADGRKPGLWIKTHANSAARVNGTKIMKVEADTEVRAGVLLVEILSTEVAE